MKTLGTQTREEKIQKLKDIQAGKLPIGEIINNGVWFWRQVGKRIYCENPEFPQFDIDQSDFEDFKRKVGGFHWYERKTYEITINGEKLVMDAHEKDEIIPRIGGKHIVLNRRDDAAPCPAWSLGVLSNRGEFEFFLGMRPDHPRREYILDLLNKDRRSVHIPSPVKNDQPARVTAEEIPDTLPADVICIDMYQKENTNQDSVITKIILNPNRRLAR